MGVARRFARVLCVVTVLSGCRTMDSQPVGERGARHPVGIPRVRLPQTEPSRTATVAWQADSEGEDSTATNRAMVSSATLMDSLSMTRLGSKEAGDPGHGALMQESEVPVRWTGFSMLSSLEEESVIQVGITGPIRPGLSWIGELAAIRYLDEPMLDDLDNTDLGWVTLGIRFQF